MKVLFQTRGDTFTRPGGDTVQMKKTAEELRRLGVEVDINLSWNLDLSSYDLVHVFQLQWAVEPYLLAQNVKKQCKPLVLSPIHHSEEEVRRWEEQEQYDFRRLSNVLFRKQEHRDVLKNVYRSVFDLQLGKLYPTLLSIKEGFRNQQRKVLEQSDVVLVQTNKEAADIERDYGTKIKWVKVVNGVGDIFLEQGGQEGLGIRDYILTVGRIESRKNQLRIIDAVSAVRKETGKDLRLIIVGSYNNHHPEYTLRFLLKKRGLGWITHIPKVDYEKMPSLYRRAKVCVSASWFETSGLTLLEAVLSECNVVATGERSKEYLGDAAFYCDPADSASIAKAIKLAVDAPRPKPSEEMRSTYTWRKVAKETLKVYNGLLR